MTPLQRCQPLMCHNTALVVIRTHLNHQSVSVSVCLVSHLIYMLIFFKKAWGTSRLWTSKCFNSFFSFVYTLLNYCTPSMTWTAILSRRAINWRFEDGGSLGKRAFKYRFSVFTELQYIISKTNKLFHHLHNCISRATQIIWTKCSIQSVGTVVKVDSAKQPRVTLV